jgi:hypothetical protein
MRRAAVGWVLVMTLTAWAGDDSCCCCDGGRVVYSLFTPIQLSVSPVAEATLRSAPEVAAVVGAVTAVELVETSSLPVETFYDGAGNRVGVATYTVTGATGSATLRVYVRESSGNWETIAVADESSGAAIVGSVPGDLRSGGGGGWD